MSVGYYLSLGLLALFGLHRALRCGLFGYKVVKIQQLYINDKLNNSILTQRDVIEHIAYQAAVLTLQDKFYNSYEILYSVDGRLYLTASKSLRPLKLIINGKNIRV